MKIKEITMVIGRILGIAISITLISYTIFAWTGPTGEPPNENLSGPLNSSAETQYKTGALGIGGLFQTDTETHLSISGGNVGIGTTNPSRSLTIESTAEHLQLNNPNAGSNITRIFMNGNGDLEFLTGTTPTNRMFIGQNGNIGIGTINPQTKFALVGDMNLSGNLTVNGTITNSTKPAFSVVNTVSSTVSSNSILPWTVEITNNGNHFDLNNNRFVAPVDGIYFFNVQILVNNSSTIADIRLYKNNINTKISGYSVSNVTGYKQAILTAMLPMNAGDYIDVRTLNSFAYYGHTDHYHTIFSGMLITGN